MAILHEGESLPVKLIIYDANTMQRLTPVIPAAYPVGQDLIQFLRTIVPHPDLSEKSIYFMTNCDDAIVDRIDSTNPQHEYYHLLAIITNKEDPCLWDNKRQFLNSISDKKTHNVFEQFLFFTPFGDEKILELSTKILRFINYPLLTNFVDNFKGLISLTEEDAEAISIKYYTSDTIWQSRISSKKKGENLSPYQKKIAFCQDIASTSQPFVFYAIRSVIQNNDLLIIDHMENNTRTLKTFRKENKNAERICYKDTGNRILSMSLLKDRKINLDMGFIMQALHPEAGLAYMNELIESVSEKPLATCVTGTDEFYILTWNADNRACRIFHSAVDKRLFREFIASFRVPAMPNCFVFLEAYDVFLMGVSTDLYLIETDIPKPSPKRLNELFSANRERFEVNGEVRGLGTCRLKDKDVFVIVQDHQISFAKFCMAYA